MIKNYIVRFKSIPSDFMDNALTVFVYLVSIIWSAFILSSLSPNGDVNFAEIISQLLLLLSFLIFLLISRIFAENENQSKMTKPLAAIFSLASVVCLIIGIILALGIIHIIV